MGLLSLIKNLISGFESEEKKLEVYLSAHSPYVQGIISFAEKEYAALSVDDKIVKIINIVETILHIPATFQTYTPTLEAIAKNFVINAYQNWLQSNNIESTEVKSEQAASSGSDTVPAA